MGDREPFGGRKGIDILVPAEQHQFTIFSDDLIANSRWVREHSKELLNPHQLDTLRLRAETLVELMKKMNYTFLDLDTELQDAIERLGFASLFKKKITSPPEPEVTELRETLFSADEQYRTEFQRYIDEINKELKSLKLGDGTAKDRIIEHVHDILRLLQISPLSLDEFLERYSENVKENVKRLVKKYPLS